ncbi:hypothetical protein DMC18_03595 [Caulobacter sp. D5]|uniref:hypothetical protein n=1 Tax=unclassified Caulobacter TaxID=2648921 RepID=UPI000D8DB626|nr:MULTISPECIES: hypothetical protein [unclassified Caulobacter]PXA95617.1 hypothetical protein DMC18_03595 [Caulobacter sp. D5]
MRDDGYTLAEALAAIAMIALAIGGLTQAVHLIGRVQSNATTEARSQADLARLQQALDQHLSNIGLVWSDLGGAFGSARSASLPCAGQAACVMSLAWDGNGETLSVTDARGMRRDYVIGSQRASLRFIDAKGAHTGWPPADPRPRRPLLAVAIVDEGRSQRPLAVGRVWSRQPAPCQFDAVSGQCRDAS